MEIPLDALPAFFGIPPVTGEREGTMSVGDGTAVGTGEKGPRVREAAEGLERSMIGTLMFFPPEIDPRL